MKKFICMLASIMICITALFCGACGDGGEEETKPLITQNTQTFINIVADIKEPVTVDSGYKIEAALLVYDYLNADEKGNADVAASKTRLDGLKSKYDVVKAEADRLAEIAREEKLVTNFINAVNELPNKLKTDDRETINGLIEKYDQLKAESKQKTEVIDAYGKLTEADAKVAELEEAARLEIIKDTAEKFISAVEEIEEVTLETGTTLENLLYDFEDFDEDVKAYAGVAEAKTKLDGMYAEYSVMRDEEDVKNFKALVEALTPVEEKVTLENESAVTKAESAYKYMSDNAKNADGVAEAYAILQQAREKFDALFAVAEAARVQEFIAAANKVGTDTDNVDISWFDVLDAASKAYNALAWDSHDLPEVKEAFTRWNAAQTVFDRKGYKQIPMSDPSIVFSGDYPPHIVLQNVGNMVNPLLEFYNANSLSEISSKVTVWLNVYIDGVYIARGALDTTDLALIIQNSKIQNILKNLSEEHSEIVSGGSFSFSFNFEDNKNEFIPSAKTKISANKAYTF